MKRYLIIITIILMISTGSFATPSTQVWNPSTDIQAVGTVHLGIDNYFTLVWPQDGGYSYPTDIGLTYGLIPGLEIGIDGFYPSSTQYTFNAKYAIAEGKLPAMALGAFNLGFDAEGNGYSADQNILYAVIAKTYAPGRLTLGYYSGNEKVLVNDDGDAAATGYILSWDKQLTDKIWVSIDHATGYSAYGATFYGLSYLFSSNTSIIFAYGTYNNGASPTVTTQLDINI